MDREETIRSWYKDWLEKIQSVHSIFADTHGEDRVDLQVPSEEYFVGHILAASDRLISSYGAEVGIKSHFNFNSVSTIPDDVWDVCSDSIKTASMVAMRSSIIVHYPEATIENEDGRKHTIKDFYTKVDILGDGRLKTGPLFNRTHYTYVEFVADYMHSHIYEIPKWDFTNWQGGCLGTGPINDTIMRLSLGYEWELWLLFVVQLDQYVHVESVRGVPYHHLSALGRNSKKKRETETRLFLDPLSLNFGRGGNPVIHWNIYTDDFINEFTKYLCENFSTTGLFIRYDCGIYLWGSPFLETVLTISNMFIEWFNNLKASGATNTTFSSLMVDGFLKNSHIDGDRIVTEIEEERQIQDYSYYKGKFVLTFKGERKYVEIEPPLTDVVGPDPNGVTLLNTKIVGAIINSITNTLNIEYGFRNHSLTDTSAPISRRQYQV